MYGIFRKSLKRAFQTCMGHVGVGVPKKKYLAGNAVGSGLWAVFLCLVGEVLDFCETRSIDAASELFEFCDNKS